MPKPNQSFYLAHFTHRGGDPVIHANPNMYNDQQRDSRVDPYVTPFVPCTPPEE